jgi:hypothetical protein
MHKFYVSIAEVDFNSSSKMFEISLKFIGHDLEEAMTASGIPILHLGTEKEHEKADYYLQKYIKESFSLIAEETALNIRFIGKEINNDDFIYCYLESEKIDPLPKQITIRNSLLTEVFDKQSNTVYLTVGSQKINCQLNKSKVSETHEIKQ